MNRAASRTAAAASRSAAALSSAAATSSHRQTGFSASVARKAWLALRAWAQPGVPGQPWPTGRQREAAPRIAKSRWRAASSVVSAIASCLTDFWFLRLATASCAWTEGPARHCGNSPGGSTASGTVPPSPALLRRPPGWLRCWRGGLPRGPRRRGLRRRFLLCRCRILCRCLLRGWWGGLGQRGQVND